VGEALSAIHAMGVVHLDWYPSNFMWIYNEESQRIQVKIIDFDSAHLIADGLSIMTMGRMASLPDRLLLTGIELNGRADLRNFDVSLMKLLLKNAGDEGLYTSNKTDLDKCFNRIIQQEAMLFR